MHIGNMVNSIACNQSFISYRNDNYGEVTVQTLTVQSSLLVWSFQGILILYITLNGLCYPIRIQLLHDFQILVFSTSHPVNEEVKVNAAATDSERLDIVFLLEHFVLSFQILKIGNLSAFCAFFEPL